MANQNTYLSAEEVYDLRGLVTLGGDGLRTLVSMALSRVPGPDRLIAIAEGAFVLADRDHGTHVSHDFLRGRSVLILTPDVFALDEEAQIEAVLDLAAGLVLGSRRLTDRPRQWDPLEYLGPDGKFIVPLVRREAELDRKALVLRWLRAWFLSCRPGAESAPAE